MKINEKFEGGNPIVIPRQILRIMKLTIVIMTACLLQVSALTKAQITMKTSSQSVQKVLETISIQSGYDFVYSTADLKRLNVTNINLNNATIETALKVCFANLPLQYEIADKTVMIKRKDEPSYIDKLIERFQSIDVTGKIVDAEGNALPGATVKVKATGKGVSTDVKGNFHLKNVEEGSVLVVSYTGYISREVKAEKDMGSIVLEVSLSKLDEVQVIAYGTTTQRLSTGNVTTIKADVIEKQPVNNPLLALQGRVPGLLIEQATGFAGTGVKVRIQGQNSLNNGSDPLYVVDGVPYNSQPLPGGNPILGKSGGTGTDSQILYGNPFTFINPSDIESIDVLKDADATAIYGSRAANGAILITTKKGKSGDTRINFNLQSGLAKVPRKLKLMTSDQYLNMRREALRNDGILNFAPGNSGDNDLNGNWDNTRYTDWQKELIGGTAGYQDLNASISGGDDRTVFLFGTGFHRETNVFPGDFSDKKASVHFSVNNLSLNQKFRIQFSGSYIYDSNKLPDKDLTAAAMTLAPVAPHLLDPEGNLNWEPDASGKSTLFMNPLSYTYNQYLNNTSNTTANLVLSYELLPGLTIKSNLGYNKINSNAINKISLQTSAPEYRQYTSRSTTFSRADNSSWTVEPQLTYTYSHNKWKLESLLGTTILQSTANGSSIVASGFSNDLVMDDILSANNLRPGYSTNSVYKYNALFGRVNLNWNDKYIVNLTGRRDGSSRFGPKNQFHNFGAFGTSWVFSNEDYLKDQLGFLSFGKLRGSYGITGSDQIGDYRYFSLLEPIAQTLPYQGVPIYTPNRLTNPYLEWEATKKMQFGIDLGFLKDKFLINANYYVNRSSNQLNEYSLPWTTGFSGITTNQKFKIKNSGWELMLSGSIVQNENFAWKSAFNLTLPNTLLVDYPDILNSSAGQKLAVGDPLSAEYIYHYLGVDPVTGRYQFADRNGNPTVSPDPNQDRTVRVDMAPKFFGGYQNTFIYKAVQLDFLFSFVKQVAPNYTFGSFPGAGIFYSGQGNQPTTLLSRWQQMGDVSNIQKYTSGFSLLQSYSDIYRSDAGITDASYIRLKNVSFSWNLPSNWFHEVGIKGCNLFVLGQNLLTFTRYSGLDPETRSSVTLPPLRVISIGAKLTL